MSQTREHLWTVVGHLACGASGDGCVARRCQACARGCLRVGAMASLGQYTFGACAAVDVHACATHVPCTHRQTTGRGLAQSSVYNRVGPRACARQGERAHPTRYGRYGHRSPAPGRCVRSDARVCPPPRSRPVSSRDVSARARVERERVCGTGTCPLGSGETIRQNWRVFLFGVCEGTRSHSGSPSADFSSARCTPRWHRIGYFTFRDHARSVLSI